MSNPILDGWRYGISARRAKQDEELRAAAELRAQQDFQNDQTQFANRQAGLADLQSEFGDRAYTPTEFGQLQGTTDRAAAADLGRQNSKALLKDNADARAKAAMANGLRLFDGVVSKAVEAGGDPSEAIAQTLGQLTPQAQALFGLDDPATRDAMIAQAAQDPTVFRQQLTALTPPPPRSGSVPAPKTFEGVATLSDGTTRRVTLARTADGQEAIVGGLPEGLDVTGFTPDRPFAPKRVGTAMVQSAGGDGGIETVGYVGGALENAERVKTRGRTVGKAEGQTIAEDMPLSQTASNEVGRTLRNKAAEVADTAMLIDRVVDQVDWSSAGSIQGLKRVDGSGPANVAANLGTIQARATFDQLNSIRQAGMTLGQVTEKEIDLLGRAVRALEQSQSPEQLKQNLVEYKKRLQRSVQLLQKDYQADIKRGRVRPMSGGSPVAAPKRVSAADFLGGG